jgi:hypothetical protein
MKRTVVLLFVFMLSACATPEPAKPLVSDFNGDSVKILIPDTKPRPEDQAEADRLCKTRERKAEFTSTTPKAEYIASLGMTVYRYEHLFVCV